jgi:hypothetical protein
MTVEVRGRRSACLQEDIAYFEDGNALNGRRSTSRTLARRLGARQPFAGTGCSPECTASGRVQMDGNLRLRLEKSKI